MPLAIPILNGIYTSGAGDFRAAYPVNLIPVPVESGISKGYLRPADGLVKQGDGPGPSRGGIVWRNQMYRVLGSKLCRVSQNGAVTQLGDVGSGGLVSMAYGFDRLAITSGGNGYYWDGSDLVQIEDEDLGTVLNVRWVDGYFLFTDGEFIIQSELNDPTSFNLLKYGSAEVDPDAIVGIEVNRNEMYAVGRNTIEVFQNVGGTGFAFQRIPGGHIQKGAVGARAYCVFNDAIAFVGNGRNEAPAVYIGDNAQTVRISTREIDLLLSSYSDTQLATIELEAITRAGHRFLYIHLPDRTMVYDLSATTLLEDPVWFTLTSATDGFSTYRGRHFLWLNGSMFCADPTSTEIGETSDQIGSHWGETVRHEFQTMVIHGEQVGGVFHRLELVGLTGRISAGQARPVAQPGDWILQTGFWADSGVWDDDAFWIDGTLYKSPDPKVSMCWSKDGMNWSMPRWASCGRRGELAKRITWLQAGMFDKWRLQRFTWDSSAHMSVARCEAEIEPLMV